MGFEARRGRAATTDGSKQTRYVVGAHAAGLLDARKQMTDERCVAMMTERFGLGAGADRGA